MSSFKLWYRLSFLIDIKSYIIVQHFLCNIKSLNDSKNTEVYEMKSLTII